jgi:uncharacterized iron-regulated protein
VGIYRKFRAMSICSKLLIAAVVLLLLLYVRERSSEGMPRVFRVSDGRTISYGQMIGEIRTTSLIFFGEIHSSEADHLLELDIIKSLHDARVPLAVGFEMFKSGSQEALDQWVKGTLSREQFIRLYYRNWGMPWPLYRDILMYVREEGIPAVGLNLPDEISRKVDRDGFSSLTGKELEMLPPGISCSVDKQYMEFIKRAYQEHERPGGRFVNFCEAQMLWNKTMAWHLVGYLKTHGDNIVVVITGAGHAWKRAIPEQVRELSGEMSYRVILPEIPGYIEPKDITAADADYIILKD